MEESSITMWLGNDTSNRGIGLPDRHSKILNTCVVVLSPMRKLPRQGPTKHPPRVPSFRHIQLSKNPQLTRWLGNEPFNWGTRLPDTHNRILNTRAAELSPTRADCPAKGLRHTRPKGTLTVSGSNDVLTLAWGTPEHGGRVRGIGAGVSPSQFFNLPRQQRVKFADKLKENVMEAVKEETLRIEARAKESVLEAVRAEREYMLKQFSQLIPNFDPNMLKTPSSPIPLLPQEQSPKSPMSDKASCSGATNDFSKLDLPPPLLTLCQYAETKLKALNKTVGIKMLGEVFGCEHDTYILHEDIFQLASMVEIGSTVIVVYMRVHWVLAILRPDKETVYFMDSLPNHMVDENLRNIVNTNDGLTFALGTPEHGGRV
ncbi:unnamed protein product [Prunus brigantina]